MNAFISYAMDSLLESVESICDLFLVTAKEVGGQTVSVVNDCIKQFNSSYDRARRGTEDLLDGLAGMILAPVTLSMTLAAVPCFAVTWVILFALSAIAHTATVPIVYIWVLYRKLQEAFKPLPERIDYFPDLEKASDRVIPIAPPILALSSLALIAGIGVELPPVTYDWTESFIPSIQEAEAHQVKTLDVETFRRGLEQQFNVVVPSRTWKDYILQNLTLPPVEEIPTTQIDSEVERSLPSEVQIAPELPLRPANFVLQRWEKEQLVTFCDRINVIQRGSITKYKKASKTLLIKKIKAFYDA